MRRSGTAPHGKEQVNSLAKAAKGVFVSQLGAPALLGITFFLLRFYLQRFKASRLGGNPELWVFEGALIAVPPARRSQQTCKTCASAGPLARRTVSLILFVMRARTLPPSPSPGSPTGFLAGQIISLLLWFRSCCCVSVSASYTFLLCGVKPGRLRAGAGSSHPRLWIKPFASAYTMISS